MVPRSRRRKRLIGLVVVAVLLVLFLAVKIAPTTRSGEKVAGGFSDEPFGPFAGQVWIGPVQSVGASFTVPRIARGSALSVASTWIGVQGQGPPARFVQIGVIESRFWSRQKQRRVDAYFAFWSDTAQHFAARPLFPVNAGDSLSASLTLANKQWMLAITDDTSLEKSRFAIAGEASAPFNQAEWTQEDPGYPDDHARYPQMEAPAFQHLTVNSTTPVRAYSTWMSVNRINLAPTALHDGSFTLRQAPAVSAAGLQYVRLARTALDAFDTFETERTRWTLKTPYAHIMSAVSRTVEAMQRFNRAMLSARWSPRIRGLVRASTAAEAVFLRRAQPPALLTAATFAAWNSQLTEAAERAATPGSRLRVALGLPGLGFAAKTR